MWNRKSLPGFFALLALLIFFSPQAMACDCSTKGSSGFLCEAQCTQESSLQTASSNIIKAASNQTSTQKQKSWKDWRRRMERHYRGDHHHNRRDRNCFTNELGDRVCPDEKTSTPTAPAPTPAPVPVPTQPADATPERNFDLPGAPAPAPTSTATLEWPSGFECQADGEAVAGAAPLGQPAADWKLTFSEEFNTFDTSKWNDAIWYETSSPTKNYAVEGGTLKIWPERDAAGKFVNRTIDTDGKFSQAYGFFEIQAKLPKGKGVWPAFWLLNHSGSARPTIDVMQSWPGGGTAGGYGDANLNPIAFQAGTWLSNGTDAGHKTLKTIDLSQAFHTYGVKWEPGKQTFYFDGVPFHQTSATMSEPLYIILDLWFGKTSGTPDNTTPQGKNNAFEITYVRAWQSGENCEPAEPAPAPAPSCPAGTTANTTQKIIEYHGDSTILTDYLGKSPAAILDENLPSNYTVKNEGVNSSTLAKLLNGTDGKHTKLQDWVAQSNADYFIFNHAINDQGTPLATYKQQLNQVIDIVQAAGKFVILETPNPVAKSDLKPYADAMLEVAMARQVTLINQFNKLMKLVTEENRTVQSLLTDDLHPNQETVNFKGQHAATIFKAMTGAVNCTPNTPTQPPACTPSSPTGTQVAAGPSASYALKPASGKTYYVSPSGNDGNAGTQSSPWKTIQKAANTLNAGDTAILLDGTYEEGSISFKRSGSSGKPIMIQAQNKWKAILSSTSGCSPGMSVNASYITVRGLHLTVSPRNKTCPEFTSANVHIRAWNSVNATPSNPTTGHTGFHADMLKINAGLEKADAIKSNQDFTIIENSESGNALELLGTKNSIIRNNVIVGQNRFGISIFAKGGDRNAQIYNNIIHNKAKNAQSIIIGGYSCDACHFDTKTNIEAYNTVAYNNVVINESGGSMAALVFQGAKDSAFINNTVIDGQLSMQRGGHNSGPQAPTQNATFKNNIVICGGKAVGSSIGWTSNHTGTLTIDNNNFHNCTGIPNQAHPVTGDPKLVNASSNWQLQTGSPAIDKGAPVSIKGFDGSTLMTMTKDIANAARPQGSAIDVGAYEFGATPAPANDNCTPVPAPAPAPTPAPAPGNCTTTNPSGGKTAYVPGSAFAGAQGGGAVAKGGRGGRAIFVTNLNDSGPGSLRACVSASGPRTCIFKVSGTIEVQSPMWVFNPYLTVAGQTSPGGIQISGKKYIDYMVFIETDEVIWRYTRMRHGYFPGSDNKGGVMSVRGKNVIVDHNSVSWNLDESLSAWSHGGDQTKNITFSYNLISEGLVPHATGPLVGGATASAMTDIDMHHNLMMNNTHRNPLLKNRSSRVVNNIMYNQGHNYQGFFVSQLSGGIQADFIGNKYKAGPFTKNPWHEIQISPYDPAPHDSASGDPSIYLNGNIGWSQPNPSGDQWVMARQSAGENQREVGNVPAAWKRSTPLPATQFPIVAESVGSIESSILPTVGASQRLDCAGNWVDARDTTDKRNINEYKTGTGISSMLMNESTVGGFPSMPQGTPCADSDNDGIPNEYEAKNPNGTLEQYLDGNGSSTATCTPSTPAPTPAPAPTPTPAPAPAPDNCYTNVQGDRVCGGQAPAPAPAPAPTDTASGSCKAYLNGPAPVGQTSPDWKMTFSEEFTSFNTKMWNDTIWYEQSNPTKNYTVEGGALKIWPQRDASGKFFNRTIDTDGKYYQTYGYFEIEAKLPIGKGTWPAFWLFNHIGDRRPEMDVMEAYAGGGPDSGWSDANFHPTAFAATVWRTLGDNAGHKTLQTVDLSQGFHTYAVKWEPGKQTYYFDGKPFWELNISMGDPMYLMLDLWFGSASGQPDNSTPQGKNNSYVVNYVRAWQNCAGQQTAPAPNQTTAPTTGTSTGSIDPKSTTPILAPTTSNPSPTNPMPAPAPTNPPIAANSCNDAGEMPNSLRIVQDDMALLSDAIGPSIAQYDWSKKAFATMGAKAHGTAVPSWYPLNSQYRDVWWTSLVPWGVLVDGPNNPATNSRVAIKDMKAYYFSKSSKKWIHVSTTAAPEGANYTFSDDSSVSAGSRREPDGSFSTDPGSGVFHFFTGSTTVKHAAFNASDSDGIFITAKARLVCNNKSATDDRNQAKFLMSVGADYYPANAGNLGAPYNPGAGGGRFKYVTPQWQSFNAYFLNFPIANSPPPF